MSSFKPVYVSVKPEEIMHGLAGLKPLHVYHIDIKPEVLPLIIIPGFMGTKLYGFDPETHKKVTIWDPDSPYSMLWAYGSPNCNAKDKKKAFIGEKWFNENHLHIENYDDPHNPYLHDCISKTFYGGLIKELSNPGTWTSYNYFFSKLPVYSFPYNWTDDNVNSAKKLKEYVEKIINSYKAKGKRCERVILITHSMGGLVARYACKNFISEKVLGVIHVAQPVNGAASTFWRMKCGIERSDKSGSAIKNHFVAWTLGTDGEEVTAVLGNMPSALQTLPNCQYTDNQRNPVWLRFSFVDGDNKPLTGKQLQEVRKFIDLPQHGDPYEEIYKKFDQGYYLINKYYLSPGKPKLTAQLLTQYLINIDKAKEFHDNIKDYSHPLTFNICGIGHKYPIADGIFYKVVLREAVLSEKCDVLITQGKIEEAKRCVADPFHLLSYDGARRMGDLYDSNRGGFKQIIIERQNKVLEISLTEIDGEGDGTVSISSGRALMGKGGNHPSNTKSIENLKHDAALSGSGDNVPSKDCIEMIIKDVKSILEQQINKFKIDHPNCLVIEEKSMAICVDEKQGGK